MKNLKQIAEENHLTYNVTDIESQGQENEVLYGFESYDQAEEIADENGLTLYYIETHFDPENNNDEKLYWNEKKPAEGPMVIDNDFLYDNNIYNWVDEYSVYNNYDELEESALDYLRKNIGFTKGELSSIKKVQDFIDKINELKSTFEDEDIDNGNVYSPENIVGIVDTKNWSFVESCEKECVIFDKLFYDDTMIFLVAIKED